MMIPKFDIRKWMETYTRFSMAKDLYGLNRVHQYQVNLERNFFIVKGEVEQEHHLYTCNFTFNKNGRIIAYQCSCGSSQLCAHAGAIMFKMNNTYIPNLPYRFDREEARKKSFNFDAWLQEQRREQIKKDEVERKRKEEERKLLEERLRYEREQREKLRIQSLQDDISSFIKNQKEEFETNIHAIMDVNMYSLYPEIIYSEPYFSLVYRIGTEDKRYVVKNITELLKDFEVGNIKSYGKNFMIDHDISRLDDFSKQQLNFLKDVSNFPLQYNADYSYVGFFRRIPLLARRIGLLRAFFNTYMNKKYDSFSVVEANDPIKMTLVDHSDYYTLTLEPDDCRILDGNEMYLLPQNHQEPFVFKRVLLDKRGGVKKLLHMCENHEQETLYINKAEWHDFYKFVLEPIEAYLEIKNLQIEEKTYSKIQFYADVNDNDEIEGRLYYLDKNDVKRPAFHEQKLDYNQEIVETIIKRYGSEIREDVVIFDSNQQKTIEFFGEGVDRLKDICEIYVSDVLRNMNKKANHTITVGVKVKNDLLSVDIQSVDIPKEEIAYVLSAYRRKKKFYRLKDGSILKLDSDELENLDEFVTQQQINLNELKNDEIILEKNRMFTLQEDENIQKDDSFRQQLEDFHTLSQNDIEIPNDYQTILRDYQKEGYRWLYTMHQYGFNGILADDMGLGKTLQVISLLEGIKTDKPSIVVCPASLVYNWEDEVHKFSKKLKVACVVGNKKTRLDYIDHYQDYDLLVTSYDYIRRDQENYEALEFEYVILDEAQYIKNKNTKNAESVKKLKTNHRLALTGTPIENTLAELWSIFDFLMPGYLYNYHYFKKTFESKIVKEGNEEVSSKLRKMVSPFILRRNKKEVLKELPDKIENNQMIPFNIEEKKLYMASLSQISSQLQSMFDSPNIDQMMILAMLTRLRQLCIDPRLVYEEIKQPSSKITALMELLGQLKENKQHTLVFSSFPSVFEYIEEELRKENISYLTLTGANNKEERRKMVEQFQNGEVDVFLISLKAGGTGLNLTEASAVIHIDPWWNVSSQNQATDRAYRIGQKNNVHVFKLVMKNSIEEKIVKLQEMKKELADTFVENNRGGISSMSKNEIIDLFKME